MLSIIVAVAKNGVIGKDNALIWKLPEDLKRFRRITTGHTIIMGRKTFESLGGTLPDRKHVVLSKNPFAIINNGQVEFVHSIADLKKYIDDDEEHFVIGGAMIYKLLMPYCKRIYLTLLDKEFDGDVYFPQIDEKVWKEISREKGPEDGINDFDYEYITYIRR